MNAYDHITAEDLSFTTGRTTMFGRLADLESLELPNGDVLRVINVHTGSTPVKVEVRDSRTWTPVPSWTQFFTNIDDAHEFAAQVEYLY